MLLVFTGINTLASNLLTYQALNDVTAHTILDVFFIVLQIIDAYCEIFVPFK